LFAEKLYSTVVAAIDNFAGKEEPAVIRDGYKVTFRCVVGAEVWTLTVHMPKDEILKLTNICKQLYEDIKANSVDESKYIALFESITGCDSDKKENLQVNLFELLEQGGSFLDATISKEQRQAYKKLGETVIQDIEGANIAIAKDSAVLNAIKKKMPIQMEQIREKIAKW
jgi:hypothetical protein